MLTSKFVCTVGILFIGSKVMLAKRQSWELTKVVCDDVAKDLFIVKRCNLTKNAGGGMVFSARVHLLQKLGNMTMKIKVMRQTGRNYRPFFAEATIDICSFLKDYKLQIPWGLMFEGFSKSSNINHSCPYNHDLIVDNFELNSDVMKMIPMPKGDYLGQASIFDNKVAKLKFQFFGRRNF